VITDLALLVLRCSDLAASKACFEALGLAFHAEKHGASPEHWSCRIGDTVLELYPASQPFSPSERLGFRVLDVAAAVAAAVAAGGRSEGTRVVLDPDGRKIELSSAEAVKTLPARWAVWRQDDNGNRFLISSGHSRADAERLCAEFEHRGHKQMYWTSPEDA
jgi:lactoylglutathione lyase